MCAREREVSAELLIAFLPHSANIGPVRTEQKVQRNRNGLWAEPAGTAAREH